jgi:polyketide cyclase/dehydrase/lipid transport protein
MLKLRLPYTHEIEVSSTPQVAYDLLADVPDSAAHFPQLDVVIPEPAGAWTWKTKKIGIGKISVQTTYALRYANRPEEHTIVWEPVPEVGNGRSRGSWVIKETPRGARLYFENVFEVEFRGLPGLLRRGVEPFAIKENARIIRLYMANLAKTLSGGNGRVR